MKLCLNYPKMGENILIIKAGYSEFLEEENDSRKVSFGDVLRTTTLLHLYKKDFVTWVTDEQAFPLLKGNPYISRLLRFDWITLEQLKKERFDVLINLEKVPGICAIADSISAWKKYGFRFDSEKRKAEAYDKAFEVLAVSSDPKMKQLNKKSDQELLFEMVGAKWNGEEYILNKPKMQEIYDIGLNTQIGTKWPTKKWPSPYWDILEEMLIKNGFNVSRQEKQEGVLEDINKYMNWVDSCKMIVTGDTLGLHLAIAFKKKIIPLFGPTPYIEIPIYGRGKVILPEPIPECMPCFSSFCKRGKNCMQEISPEMVYSEINKIFQQDKA